MVDNGLIEKYFKNKDLSEHGATFHVDKITSAVSKHVIEKSDSKVENFYFKSSIKENSDAEILLSQVYAKAGFNTAIYLPVTMTSSEGGMLKGVISNDVSTVEKTIDPKMQFLKFYGATPNIEKTLSAAEYGPRLILPYEINQYTAQIANDNLGFSYDCIRQILKMRLFDVGALNEDRHFNNFFYKFDAEGKADSIALIDHGYSYFGYKDYERNAHDIFYSCTQYYNDFLTPRDFILHIRNKSRNGMIDNFKHNESMQEYITPRELVETLEQVDVKATARDIYDTIGYKVGEEYVDTIAESFENLAEEVSEA